MTFTRIASPGGQPDDGAHPEREHRGRNPTRGVHTFLEPPEEDHRHVRTSDGDHGVDGSEPAVEADENHHEGGAQAVFDPTEPVDPAQEVCFVDAATEGGRCQVIQRRQPEEDCDRAADAHREQCLRGGRCCPRWSRREAGGDVDCEVARQHHDQERLCHVQDREAVVPSLQTLQARRGHAGGGQPTFTEYLARPSVISRRTCDPASTSTGLGLGSTRLHPERSDVAATRVLNRDVEVALVGGIRGAGHIEGARRRREGVEVALVAVSHSSFNRDGHPDLTGIGELPGASPGFTAVFLLDEIDRERVVGGTLGDDHLEGAGVLLRQQHRQVGFRSGRYPFAEEPIPGELHREI